MSAPLKRPESQQLAADAGSGAAAPPAGAIPAATAATGPWLMHVPVPLFAVVMGVTGLGIAWRKAAHVLATPPVVGEAIIGLAAILFVAICVLYGTKALLFPEAVKKEFTHPIRANFFPTISIAVLLLSNGAFPYAPGVAYGLWAFGAVLHIALTVMLLKRWFLHDTHIAHSNPAWFIPIVGNVIVSLTGIHFGHVEIAWFFFSIGIVFWLVLKALLVYRIVFHDPMPLKILPTLFIFMAPPAAGYLSYVAMTGGVVDSFARVLLYNGLFLALLLASMTRTFLKVPFAVSWWAYTFPSAVLACAVLDYWRPHWLARGNEGDRVGAAGHCQPHHRHRLCENAQGGDRRAPVCP